MTITKLRATFLFLIIVTFQIKSQDTLILNRQQCETIFLKENLFLLSERLEIPKAEAILLQSKLWPNPSITLDDVNLWATKKQLSVFGQELPGFTGGAFGKNQEFSFSIEQLITTAGKRQKSIELEQINVEKSKQNFNEILRNLKFEFRDQLTQLQYLQLNLNIYKKQIENINQLLITYDKQVELGNISKAEYIRLKAEQLEFLKQINELNKEINESQKELKILMHLPPSTYLKLTDEGFSKNINQIELIDFKFIIDTAKTVRPDLKLSELENSYSHKYYEYQKAQKVPDITLKAGYDRGGSFMYNFIGFGFSIDLPIFNSNQGNIQKAYIEIEQAKLKHEQNISNATNQIILAKQNLIASIEFYKSINPEYEKTLDNLIISYNQNLKNRNISLIEYIDFLNAYLNNKKTILDAIKEVNNKAEELNFVVGSDLIK